MKRILLYLAVAAFTALFAVSCSPAEKEFNEQFLIGYWSLNDAKDDFKRFDAGHTGVEWVVSAGQSENDGRRFLWSLNGEKFLIDYCFDTSVGGCDVPKPYTMVELTQTRLVFTDGYTTRTFTKTTRPQ